MHITGRPSAGFSQHSRFAEEINNIQKSTFPVLWSKHDFGVFFLAVPTVRNSSQHVFRQQLID